MADQKGPIKLTPEMIKAICSTPLPNFAELWKQYASSDFRRQYLRAWAGDDPAKRYEVEKLLRETVPQ